MPESPTDVGEPIEILMVDDSMGDVRLAQVALEEARVRNRLSVVNDGEQAMAFLRREDGYADAPRPDLVLLDLNMPRMDGREVLAQIKGDPDLRSIPVVVLTTSEAEADIVKAYDLHANAYITKPVDLEAFLDAVRVVEEFWLTVVRLPQR
jgi:two-component system, chemotaxis family, response regulator Rcp1